MRRAGLHIPHRHQPGKALSPEQAQARKLRIQANEATARANRLRATGDRDAANDTIAEADKLRAEAAEVLNAYEDRERRAAFPPAPTSKAMPR